jgi:hypothetical protein
VSSAPSCAVPEIVGALVFVGAGVVVVVVDVVGVVAVVVVVVAAPLAADPIATEAAKPPAARHEIASIRIVRMRVSYPPPLPRYYIMA